jgi:hypothetical protein
MPTQQANVVLHRPACGSTQNAHGCIERHNTIRGQRHRCHIERFSHVKPVPSNWARILCSVPPPERCRCPSNHRQQIAPQRTRTHLGCQHCPFIGRQLTPQHQQICQSGLHGHLRQGQGKFLRHTHHQNYGLGGRGSQRMAMSPHEPLACPPGPLHHQP